MVSATVSACMLHACIVCMLMYEITFQICADAVSGQSESRVNIMDILTVFLSSTLHAFPLSQPFVSALGSPLYRRTDNHPLTVTEVQHCKRADKVILRNLFYRSFCGKEIIRTSVKT